MLYRSCSPRSARGVALFAWLQARMFLRRAGTVILAISICLWALTTYPRLPSADRGEQLRYSIAGRIGHGIEPAIRPLGFDWKIGIGLVTSLVAREVIVGTLGTIYGIEGDEQSQGLQQAVHHDLTSAGAVALVVFFAFAMAAAYQLAAF